MKIRRNLLTITNNTKFQKQNRHKAGIVFVARTGIPPRSRFRARFVVRGRTGLPPAVQLTLVIAVRGSNRSRLASLLPVRFPHWDPANKKALHLGELFCL